ncbi:MAG: hypothetical protein IJH79_20735 [Lentisphaeria bacterium]|nr:hypothetical protein [Lentisphaeria bacterium]
MTKAKTEIIEVAVLDLQKVNIRIVGETPLIVHAWSQKAKLEILDKQMKVTKTKSKTAKNPVEDFIESAYWLEGKPTEYTEEAFENAVKNGARWGFPVSSVKQGASNAKRNGIRLDGTMIKASFMIEGEGPEQLAEIKGSVPKIREDMVRLNGIGNPADIRFRAQFDTPWYMDLTLRFNRN